MREVAAIEDLGFNEAADLSPRIAWRRPKTRGRDLRCFNEAADLSPRIEDVRSAARRER